MSAAAERHIAVGELDGSPHASGVTPRALHTARSALSWGSGGRRATPAILCRRTRLRWQLRTAGGSDGPRRIDGDARLRNRSRARTSRHSSHPEVAPGVSTSRQARDGYAASDACRVRDRGNETAQLGLSKNPALALAWTPGHPHGMSSDRPSRGRPTTTPPSRRRRTSLRPSWRRP